jgi:PAS domain S-box-containing protein
LGAELTITNSEKFFSEDQIIVSKTDLKGRITYANRTFYEIAGYTEKECILKPHSLVRHPDMPRSVFQLLWDRIGSGSEVFAYVKNRAKCGGFYWVYAHVTPSYDTSAKVVGFHSNRRVPKRKILDATIIPLYRELLAVEKKHENRKEACAAGLSHLNGKLQSLGVSYDEFIHSL